MAKNFIIIEPDPVVCMDVEGMLIDKYPHCHVTAGATLADIGAAIYNCGPDSALFVKATLVLADSDLRRVLETAATRGCAIVVIGHADDLDFPASFVELPFTTDMMLAAVERQNSEDGRNASG